MVGVVIGMGGGVREGCAEGVNKGGGFGWRICVLKGR